MTGPARCLFVAMAALMLAVGCSRPSEVTIGAILVQSTRDGKPVSVGVDLLHGMELAAKDINRGGGVDGHPVRILHVDSRSDTARAKSAFLSLKDTCQVIVTMYTDISAAAVPLATEYHIPQLVVAAAGEDILKDAPYSFRYWPSASRANQAVLPLLRQLKVKRLGIYYQNNAYGRSVSVELAKALEEQGIAHKLLAFTDPASEAVKGRLDNCDAVYFVSLPSLIVETAIALRAVYPKMKLISTNSLANPETSSTPALQGVYLTAPQLYNEDYALAMSIRKKYQAAYGKPLDHFAGIGYDAVNLLSQLMKGGDLSPESIKDRLAQAFIYPGLFGDVAKESGVHEISYPLYPARIINGKIVYQAR